MSRVFRALDIHRACKIAILSAISGLAIGAGQASVIDRPFLKVEGVVIVWGADAANNAPVATDFVIDNNGSNTDLIIEDGRTVITGTLDPVDESFPDGTGATLRITGGTNQNTQQGDRYTSASDVLNPFTMQLNTDVRTIRSDILSSFYVASNKAFNIDVVSSALGDPADLNLIRLRMRVTQSGNDGGLSFGSAAQLPHSGNTPASGVQWGGYRRLSLLTGGGDIFRGNRRTALTAGSIAAQSVRFDLDYRWNTGNIDLSDGVFDVEAEVAYTVYIP